MTDRLATYDSTELLRLQHALRRLEIRARGRGDWKAAMRLQTRRLAVIAARLDAERREMGAIAIERILRGL